MGDICVWTMCVANAEDELFTWFVADDLIERAQGDGPEFFCMSTDGPKPFLSFASPQMKEDINRDKYYVNIFVATSDLIGTKSRFDDLKKDPLYLAGNKMDILISPAS